MDAFQPYLAAHERVLWSGQPKQGLGLSSRDTFLIPFSLMWGGFAIFWNAMVWLDVSHANFSANPLWFFKLWGLPFLLVGLYLIVGRFFHDAYLRKHLFYAVTDQRVLLVRGSSVTSFEIKRLPRLDLSEFSDGTGTLSFEANDGSPWGGKAGSGWWIPNLGAQSQFFRIKDPRKVYEIIRSQA